MTKERAIELFDYNPDTGIFIRLISTNSNIKVGSEAGTLDKSKRGGYLRIQADGKKYRLHRLAWLITYGSMPKIIDHINGIKTDNRICNLRDVEHSDSMKNRGLQLNSPTSCLGVTWSKPNKKWTSNITVSKKQIYLGYFNKYSDAVNVRKNAEVLYGFHENHGRV